jgi:transcription initiation factor TFIIIB Brf1 subunit/transcription initiation factor TFIIB
MAKNEVVCPICSADVPLSGDERRGEEIFCTVCGAVLKLTSDAGDEDAEAEEDM